NAEGMFEVIVPVRSKESTEYRGRRWQVVTTDQRLYEPKVLTLTPLGETVARWRQGARAFANDWLNRLAQGPQAAMAETLPPERRQAVPRELIARWVPAVLGSACCAVDQGGPCAATGLAMFANPEFVRRSLSQEYTAFADFAWLKTDNFQVARELRDQQL